MAVLQEFEIITLISIGCAVILLLMIGVVILFIEYQKQIRKAQQFGQELQREYEQQMIELQLESQDNERKRISRDLHDSIGSLLWGAKLTASCMERSAYEIDKIKILHTELMNILDQSIQTVKQISWELAPEAFQYSGLSASVVELCKRFDGKGLVVSFTETNGRVWRGVRALAAFRIIQELICNGVKHSNGNHLRVEFVWYESLLLAEVIDNGIGLKSNKIRNGVGWWNIESRARLLDAQVEVVEIPTHKGAYIRLQIPLLND
jgi:two-component system, NarL family, sensor kinase